MISRRFSHIKRIPYETHLNLIEIYISAGADILDLIDYTSREDIINLFKGADPIFGRLNKVKNISLF